VRQNVKVKGKSEAPPSISLLPSLALALRFSKCDIFKFGVGASLCNVRACEIGELMGIKE